MFYRLGFRFAYLAALLAFASGCYVTRLAFYQNSLINRRVKVEQVIAEKQVDQSEIQKLLFTREVLDFARSEGLNVGAAYDHYIAIEGKAISYTVSAAQPLAFTQETWWFPVVGSVPYLGFFQEALRDGKAKELAEQGLDVHKSDVGAFSSLGWFADPIYSTMLRRKKYSLANLLFHELVHRTVWIGGEVSFNENLADFLAEKITEDFFRSRKDGFEVLSRRKIFEQDKAIFIAWVEDLKDQLERVYQAVKEIGPNQALIEKANTLKKYVAGEKKPQFQQFDFVGKMPWNNARIMMVRTYKSKYDHLELLYQYWGRPQTLEFIELLEKYYESFPEAFQD